MNLSEIFFGMSLEDIQKNEDYQELRRKAVTVRNHIRMMVDHQLQLQLNQLFQGRRFDRMIMEARSNEQELRKVLSDIYMFLSEKM